MKKTLYVLLLAAEAYVGFFASCLMFSWGFGLFCIITLLVTAALLIWLNKRLKRQKLENHEKGMRRTRTLIALVMLLPIIPAFIVVIEIAMALAIYG